MMTKTELDTFLEPVSNLMILETKGTSEADSIVFPPFLKIKEDITGNTAFYNYNIALKK